jgi:hypothetical protein
MIWNINTTTKILFIIGKEINFGKVITEERIQKGKMKSRNTQSTRTMTQKNRCPRLPLKKFREPNLGRSLGQNQTTGQQGVIAEGESRDTTIRKKDDKITEFCLVIAARAREEEPQ